MLLYRSSATSSRDSKVSPRVMLAYGDNSLGDIELCGIFFFLLRLLFHTSTKSSKSQEVAHIDDLCYVELW